MRFLSLLQKVRERWLGSSRAGRQSRPASRRRRPVCLSMDRLEDRVTPAVLPNPLLNNQLTTIASHGGTIQSHSNPMVVMDPVNPNNLVAVFNTVVTAPAVRSIVQGAVSSNGGLSWNLFTISEDSRLIDPATPANNPAAYAESSDATVAFDRNGAFYVVYRQHRADNQTGAIFLEKFNFGFGIPTPANPFDNFFNPTNPAIESGEGVILYQWSGTNQADADVGLNPYVVVDNTLPTFIDPETGAEQVNPLLARSNINPTTGRPFGVVYVAWNTNNAVPTQVTAGFGVANFNPNTIKAVASSDGGVTFTTPRYVNTGTSDPNIRSGAPAAATGDGEGINLSGRSADPTMVIPQGTISDRPDQPRQPFAAGALIFDPVTGLATAFLPNHGFLNNEQVIIRGANEAAYNGTFIISNVTATSFTYRPASAPTVTATGNVSAQLVTVPAGIVQLVWNDFDRNSVRGQRINEGGTGAVFANSTTTTIFDALDPGNNLPHATTPSPSGVINVSITDPLFDELTDVDVTVHDLTHPNLDQLRIDLLAQVTLDGPRYLEFGNDLNNDGVPDLYVTSRNSNTVPVFDGVNGSFLRVFVPVGLGNLTAPGGLQFGPDRNGDGIEDLYVSSSARNQIVVYDGNAVGGSTAGVLTVITSPNLTQPEGLTFGPDQDGDGVEDLYVASSGNNRVLLFSGATGAFLNILVDNNVAVAAGGVSQPEAVVIGPDGNFYVSSFGSDHVMRYQSNGILLPATPLPSPTGVAALPNSAVYAFGAGLDQPTGIAFGPDNDLYVSGANNNRVFRFHGPFPTGPGQAPRAGELLSLSVTEDYVPAGRGLVRPHGLIFGRPQDGFNNVFTNAALYIANTQDQFNRRNSVIRVGFVPGLPSGFDVLNPTDTVNVTVDATFIQSFNNLLPVQGRDLLMYPLGQPAPGPINGLDHRNNFLVSSFGSDEIREYNINTGSFVRNFITGPNAPDGPEDIIFDRDLTNDNIAELLIAAFNTGQIRRYNGDTGAFIQNFINANAGAGAIAGNPFSGLNQPKGLAFGGDVDGSNDGISELYVTSLDNATGDRIILRFNGANGANVTSQVPPAGAGAFFARLPNNDSADYLLFAGGTLFVTSTNSNRIYRFNEAGVNLDAATADQSWQSALTTAPLNEPTFMFLSNDNTLLVSNHGDNSVLRFNLASANNPNIAYIERVVQYQDPTAPGNVFGFTGLGVHPSAPDRRIIVATDGPGPIEANRLYRFQGQVPQSMPAVVNGIPNAGADFVRAGGPRLIIPLVREHVTNAGTVRANVGMAGGANMGRVNAVAVGTVFDQQAPRPINDPALTGPYAAHFRPESGGLDFGGLNQLLTTASGAPATAGDINGGYILEITDMRDNRNNGVPPPQFLSQWSMRFTSRLRTQTEVNPTSFAPGAQERTVAPGNNTSGGLIPTVSPGTASAAGSNISQSGTVTGAYPNAPIAAPERGMGPGVSIAVDNTLGSFSPYQGRMYVVYTGRVAAVGNPATNTDIFLRTSDDGGITWDGPFRVNDDAAFDNAPIASSFVPGVQADNFSEGNRPQYQPSVAVDQTTGTLVVSWLDARQDPSLARLATYVTTSLNGGWLDNGAGGVRDFSKQVFVNSTRDVTDAITLETLSVEPVPSNQSTGNPNRDQRFNYGDHQGLVVHGGVIVPVWAGNLNGLTNASSTGAGLLFTARHDVNAQLGISGPGALIAAGPRAVSSNMGPIQAEVVTRDDAIDINYNNGFDVNGVPIITGFVVTFDRPIDVDSFTPDNVVVSYRSPLTPAGSPPTEDVPVLNIQPLDGFVTRFGPAQVGGTDVNGIPLLATKFLVTFAPRSAVGTYSYEVRARRRSNPGLAPIQDKVRFTTEFGPLSLGNGMDQDADGVRGEAATLLTSEDVYAVPTPVNGPPGQLPYDPTTLPLIVPGPHVLATFVQGEPATSDNLVLDGTTSSIHVVFDRDMDPASFTARDIVRLVGPQGEIPLFDAMQNPLPGVAVIPDPDPQFPRPINGVISGFSDPDPLHARTYKITFPSQLLSGTYSITLASTIFQENHVNPDVTKGDVDTNLNAGLYVLRGSDPTTSTITNVTHLNTETNPNAVPIAAAVGATASITDVPLQFTDSFLIQSLQVLLNITVADTRNLDISLVPPPSANLGGDGEILLFDNRGRGPGGPQANLTNTRFNDLATTRIQSGSPPFNGIFTPEEPLSQLLGANSLGTTVANAPWVLRIRNSGPAATLTNWGLTLGQRVPGTGLGEAVADQFSAHFRIFTLNATNALSHDTWTAVGPTGISTLDGTGTVTDNTLRDHAGRVSDLVVDTSDPSGNTVYVAAASGGIWKTTNFMTLDVRGPTWVNLTDFGPAFATNIGGISIVPRNNDPKQTIIFAATGEGNWLGYANNPGDIVEPGNEASRGVGMLRSLDGGSTWTLLDSSNNVDSTILGVGNLTPINQPFNPATGIGRDHVFAGTTVFKVLVDPVPAPNGEFIVYAAVADENPDNPGPGGVRGGVWRSLDSGRHWSRLRAGQATDLQFSQFSAYDPFNRSAPPRNQRTLFVAFRDEGVFRTNNASSPVATFQLMDGAVGNPTIRHLSDGTATVVTNPSSRTNQSVFPQGNGKGRIVLAVPQLTGHLEAGKPYDGNFVLDVGYQGWVYAAVIGTNGSLDETAGGGLFLTKDFGQTWTRVRLPYATGNARNLGFPATNDETRLDRDAAGLRGNYNLTLVVDPTNPAVVYLGGNSGFGLLRVDTTFINDSKAIMGEDHSDNDGGAVATATVGAATPTVVTTGIIPASSRPSLFHVEQLAGGVLIEDLGPHINALRDPRDVFANNATLQVSGSGAAPTTFTNDGSDTRWRVYDGGISNAAFSRSLHRFTAMVDPLTGKTRLIVGMESGVFTSVDLGNGDVLRSVGSVTPLASPGASQFTNEQQAPTTPGGDVQFVYGQRNGNLQITQFHYGAVQPSVVSAQVAQALFYANAWQNGFPVSDPSLLTNGNLDWIGPLGSGSNIAVDQTGTGTLYTWQWPGDDTHLQPTDFFSVNDPRTQLQDPRLGIFDSRTFGLFEQANDPQWQNIFFHFPANTLDASRLFPNSTFAVNPINGSQLIMGSEAGRIYRSADQGITWFKVGFAGGDASAIAAGPNRNVLDNTWISSLVFGAPDPDPQINPLNETDHYFLAGTFGGRIFLTTNGGGSFVDISNGLTGGTVLGIATNPRRGTHEAFAVTYTGVFYNPDTFAAGSTWQNITSNIFQIQADFTDHNFQITQDPAQPIFQGEFLMQYLTSMAVDWRFRQADPNNPGAPDIPYVYVGGNGGVVRSIDRGQTWTIFPDFDASVENRVNKVDGGRLPRAIIVDLDISQGNVNPTTGNPDQATGPNLLVATTYGRGMFAIRLPADDPANLQSGPVVISAQTDQPPGNVPPVSQITLFFEQTVDAFTLQPASGGIRSFVGPNNVAIPITSVIDVTGSQPPTNPPRPAQSVFQISFAPQTATGSYTLVLNPLVVSDFSGRLLNQNGTLPNGQDPADEYRLSFFIGQVSPPAGGGGGGGGAPAAPGSVSNITGRFTIIPTVRRLRGVNRWSLTVKVYNIDGQPVTRPIVAALSGRGFAVLNKAGVTTLAIPGTPFVGVSGDTLSLSGGIARATLRSRRRPMVSVVILESDGQF